MDLRPKILDWYISRKFIFTFFIALILIIGIVIIFDISEKIDDFVENEAPLNEIVFTYYLNFVPKFINMFSPLFVFITVIFFTSRLAANSEIIAILSGGISYHRMMVPYLASATLIALLSLGLNLYVIPRSNLKVVQFEAKYVKLHNDYKRSNIHYQIAPGEFVYVNSYRSWSNTAEKITLETIRDNKLVSKLSAELAVWDSTYGGWHMKDYTIREYTNGLQDRVKTGEQLDTIIPLTVTDFYRNEKTVETLTIKQLNELIDTQNLRGDANVIYAQIEKHTRYALPFSALILTIIGVALSSRKKRGATGWNIGIGIALAFSYILFLRFSQMFVFTGTLSPGIALWIPNLLYSIIAAFLYRMAPK
ncbi:MAG: LptF/LptG family permease [Bacteroidales bacterium]|nr:LptF/LptG family permease [Bacteroidales bacterium]